VTRSLVSTSFYSPVAAENNRRNSDESCELCSSELMVSVCHKQRVHGGAVTCFCMDEHSPQIAIETHDSFKITAHLISLDSALKHFASINRDNSLKVCDNG
jgi:hypothetical protein